jgi:hypothetical protein
VPNPDRRKFVNPLTQPSTESETLPSTESDTYTSTLPQVKHRKHGAQAFEHTHERITLWVDKGLKQQFEGLAVEQGTSKTQLLNEAIGDLLKKYGG